MYKKETMTVGSHLSKLQLVKVTEVTAAWVPNAQETEQQVTSVCILALATYTAQTVIKTPATLCRDGADVQYM